MTNSKSFSKQLIKGRIAEHIFDLMFQDGKYIVLSFGYENTLPELMHRQRGKKTGETMDAIRCAPDFAIINETTHEVNLVEVKYRNKIKSTEIWKLANKIHESWKPSYLFLASPEDFYFGKVSDIVEKKGKIERLKHPQISEALQTRYLKLLNEFIATEK